MKRMFGGLSETTNVGFDSNATEAIQTFSTSTTPHVTFWTTLRLQCAAVGC